MYEKRVPGKDYRGRWDATDNWQYRINVDSALSIDKREKRNVDGDINVSHWDWSNAWHITDTREIIKVLREIEKEL